MPKKPSRKPVKKIERDKSVSELIKNNNFLHQYCDFVNTENQKNSIKIMELATFLTLLERTMKEHSKMLDFIMTNMHPKAFEKMKKEFEEHGFQPRPVPPKEEPATKTARVMHDDITVKCPQCKSISTIHDKNCKECGHKI